MTFEHVLKLKQYLHRQKLKMELGFIPSEFRVLGNDSAEKNIFLCDLKMVPNDIPTNAMFIAKERATITDFNQLLTIFDKELEKLKGNSPTLVNLQCWTMLI